MSGKSTCDLCAYYVYDDEYDCYVCEVNMDEDDMCRFLQGSSESCPYFQYGDEYKIARKQ